MKGRLTSCLWVRGVADLDSRAQPVETCRWRPDPSKEQGDRGGTCRLGQPAINWLAFHEVNEPSEVFEPGLTSACAQAIRKVGMLRLRVKTSLWWRRLLAGGRAWLSTLIPSTPSYSAFTVLWGLRGNVASPWVLA